MPELRYPETHEHGPAEYFYYAEEIAEMAEPNDIADYIHNEVPATELIAIALEIYEIASDKEDSGTKHSITNAIAASIDEEGKRLLSLYLFNRHKDYLSDIIENWSVEQEANQ